MSDVDTSAEACAVACMLVSNPAGEMRHVGWQKRVNDLIRAMRDERDALRAGLVKAIEALERADGFIANGIEFGFIQMPDASTPDTAHETPDIIRDALTEIRKLLEGRPS